MLTGLTSEELEEFKKLDETLPFDGKLVWPTSGLPPIPAELRWLELWSKHRAASGRVARDARMAMPARDRALAVVDP